MGPAADAWHWSEDALEAANFCVMALIRDGLRVPPFDQHPDGDGALRNLGLDAEAWLAWVREVAAAHRRLEELFRASPADRPRDVPALVRAPAELCPGDERLRGALDEMWVSHRANLDAWKRSMTSGPLAKQRRGSGREGRDQWKALAAFREGLPTLSVLLVGYPVPTVMPLPPITLLVAPATDATDYTHQLVAGALALTSDRTPGDPH